MIIDSHVHLPPECNENTPELLLAEAAVNGINMLVVSDLGVEQWADFPNSSEIRQANMRAERFAAYDKSRILWLAYLNPQENDWQGELERSVQAGAAGIKLWISLKNDLGRLDNTVQVLKTAAKQKLPVLLHVFNRTDQNRPGEISMSEFVDLSRKISDCVMIAAHAGGNWRSSIGMLRYCSSNAYMDVSGSYPELGMVETLLQYESSDRLLFGSDAVGRSFQSQISKITLAEISPSDKEKILWRNAAQIYQIKAVPPLPDVIPSSKVRQDINLTIDHFCFCGTCPFFDTHELTPKKLEKTLTEHGVMKAFTGNLNGLLFHDLVSENRKFVEDCKGLRRIVPLPSFNPTFQNWQYQIDDAVAMHCSEAIIFPYAHNWRIDDSRFDDFFQSCNHNRINLWINCGISDHRFRHGVWNPRPLKLTELLAFIRKAPDSSYVFQHCSSQEIMAALKFCQPEKKNYFVLSSCQDCQFSLQNLVKTCGTGHLLFGSEFPFRHMLQVRNALDLSSDAC